MFLALTFEILKYLLPAVVLYFIVRLIIRAYLENEEKKRAVTKNSNTSHETLQLRLQAYERLILLLERITPSQVINRALQSGMTAYHLQMMLIQVIREEFDHNVAQQIYISPSGWAMIRTAKEEIILLINASAAEAGAGAGGGELARIILERWATLDQNPVQIAIDQLKDEVRPLF